MNWLLWYQLVAVVGQIMTSLYPNRGLELGFTGLLFFVGCRVTSTLKLKVELT